MMKRAIEKTLRKFYYQVTKSFAFVPAVISVLFLVFSICMLQLDFSTPGRHIKSTFTLIRLKDANTARSVVSTILAGIIALTVFSFSNVMIVLNQAASQLSNRILQSLISNRFQQSVLGFYIGSIVYSLFLLSSIRNSDTGIYVPALSIYLLVVVAIVDIFLFIYFLHYITQVVKYNTVIEDIRKETFTSLKKATVKKSSEPVSFDHLLKQEIKMPESNYFQGFDQKELVRFAAERNGYIELLHPIASYVLQSTPLLNFYGGQLLTEKEAGDVFKMIDLFNDESIETNYYYGFHQLSEVAVKALSPGINDPQTAVLSIHALSALFLYLIHNNIQAIFKDKNGMARVFLRQREYEDLFVECFYPVWNYGKDDLYVQQALLRMLVQLKDRSDKRYSPSLENLLREVRRKVQKETEVA